MAKEMTVDEAVRIINESFEFGNDFDAAVEYLKEHDANNGALAAFSDKNMQDVKKERAKAYVQQALAEENFDKKLDEALSLLRNDKDVQDNVAEEQEIFDKENHLEMTDEDAVLRNVKKITDITDSISYETLKEKEGAEEPDDLFDTLQDKVEIVDEDNQKVADDEAKKYWDALLESAKQQAIMLRSGDISFFMKKEDEKHQTLKRDIKDFVSMGVARGVAGSAMDVPSEKEAVVGSKDYAQYVKKEAAKAEQALSRFFEEGKKVSIKTGFFLTEAAETSKKMMSYGYRWSQKGFNRVAQVFSEKQKSFEAKMKNLFGKAYEVKQAAVEQIKNNKWRLVADTAATGIVAVTAGTGLALPVVAGYALYTAAGSWVWPLAEKKAKAIREAKKSGKDIAEWTGMKGLKKAFHEIKANDKEYKKYKNRAYTGTAFGIAGAGVVAGVGAASSWAVDKAGYMAAKVASSVLRSTGSITSQWLNLRDVKKDFKEDPSAENRAKLKQAKWGLGIGAAIAFAGNFLSFNRAVAANSGENSGGVMDKVKNWFRKEDSNTVPTPETETAQVASTNDSSAMVNATAEDSVEVAVSAPEAYDASMGISEKHWNEMHEKLTGIYENHSAIFGKENVSSAEAWDKMYQNLDTAMKANPEYFGNMTKEQFLYKYMKLVESTERVTNGPSGYLITKLDKDGLPVYADKDLTKVMRDMNAMLNCGDKFKISAEEMNKALGYIDDKTGRYMGPGANVGVTNNRYIGGRVECGDDYQNAWKRAARKVAAHRAPIAPKPVIEPEPTPEPVPEREPAKVEEVVVNETPKKQPIHIEEEVVNTQPSRRGVVIQEGATDGNLDVNNSKVGSRSRTFRVPTSGGRE